MTYVCIMCKSMYVCKYVRMRNMQVFAITYEQQHANNYRDCICSDHICVCIFTNMNDHFDVEQFVSVIGCVFIRCSTSCYQLC